MRISKWNKKKTTFRPQQKGMMISVTYQEALTLIESLAHQLSTNSCNGGRAEHICRDGSYFSIAVDDGLEAKE